MTLASLQQPSAWDQAVDRMLERLEPDPLPLDLADVGIAPQPGPQEQLVNSRADITIAGGAAGVGKTFGLLLNPLKHKDNGDFGAVLFRRETTQVKAEGGIWDESEKLYPLFAADSNLTAMKWTFPTGMTVQMAHMQHAKDRFAWDGSQIPCIGFDQLEHFEEIQFWYMFSRNRSVCGVKPYIIATCNPVPADDPIGGWLNRFIAWWIDQETGLPIPARAGKMRFFVRVNETIHWADTPDALRRKFPELGDQVQPKSVTFIPGTLADNKILQQKDPSYRANLLALPYVERERLLGGNWKVRASAGKIFNRAWFRLVDVAPRHARRVRYWDKAGTQGAGKRTAGARLSEADGIFYIEDVITGQWRSGQREKVIRQTAEMDGLAVTVWVEQEPGSGGKESAENTITNLAGYTIRADKVTGDKITRAGPLSAQAEAGNVVLVRGAWNELFLSEAQAYEEDAPFMDQIDAAAGAFNKLTAGKRPVVGAVKAGDQPGAVDPVVAAAEARRLQRLREQDDFRDLEQLVAQHGADAVEAIKRLTDPSFRLPEELRGR